MSDSRLAKDHGLRLDSVDDAMVLIASGVRRCVFTLDDLGDHFFDLRNQVAGTVFQKLINYRCEVAIVVPRNHQLGERITELAREHRSHPVVRFFSSIEDAQRW